MKWFIKINLKGKKKVVMYINNLIDNGDLSLLKDDIFLRYCNGDFEKITVDEDHLHKIVEKRLNMDISLDRLRNVALSDFAHPDNYRTDIMRKYIKLIFKYYCMKIAVNAFMDINMISPSHFRFMEPLLSLDQFAEIYQFGESYYDFALVEVDIYLNQNGQLEALLSPRIAHMHKHSDKIH